MHTNYFTKHRFTPHISLQPQGNLGICVVLPSYNEPHLDVALNALAHCIQPTCAVEIIVVVNYPEHSEPEIIENALWCVGQVNKFDQEFGNHRLRFFPISAFNLPKKHAGVGLARRMGMDEAAFRLLNTQNEHKIIACFDADATCEPNFLVELEKLWIQKPKTAGCSIAYQHPISGTKYSTDIYDTIVQYELHLRYYTDAGIYIQHPFSYQTVGSSMACSAQTYVDVGGMSKRKAGEDFYFLQKIIPHGNFEELNSTTIYPSPRPSDRVPFGTGRAILQHTSQNADEYLTYSFQSFQELKPFFTTAPQELYRASSTQITDLLAAQPKPLQEFLAMNSFEKAIDEINANSAQPETFNKRFFLWFDAFKLLKYLNFAHEKYYTRLPIAGEAKKLATTLNIYQSNSSKEDLLARFREFDLLRGVF